MIHITVPASSANLGAGFDALGVALSCYNEVWIEEAEGCHIHTLDSAPVPRGTDNMVYAAAAGLYARCGIPCPGFAIVQRSAIPFARGLGSSSACLIAGLLGANAIIGGKLPQEELLSLAAQMEGHPDNVAPALLGGLVSAVMENGRVYAVSVPVSSALSFAVFIPDFELRTEDARAMLPDVVPREDAVYNLSRTGLMTASLFAGAWENLKTACGDRLHQPYRFPAIPGVGAIFDIAYRLGAHAVCVSGAGPSVLAIVDAGDTDFPRRAAASLRTDGPDNWQVLVMPPSSGARAEPCGQMDFDKEERWL